MRENTRNPIARMRGMMRGIRIIRLGFMLAVLYCVLECIVHVFVLRDTSLAKQLFARDPHEVWMHSSTVAILLSFGIVLQSIFDKRKNAEEALQRKTDQQEQLLETARQLTASLDTEEVLTRIGVEAKEILEAYGCAIYLLEADGKTLKPVVALEPPYEKAILSTPLNVETSFTGQAVRARKGLIFNDTKTDTTGQHIPGTNELKNENVITSPFIVDGDIVGAMCLSRIETPFSEEDLTLAEVFATYASTALKNAQIHQDLLREMERSKRAEEELGRERDKAQQYLDIAGVMLVALNDKGEVTLINQKGCEVLGYSEDEIVGKNWFDNFIPGWLRETVIPVSKRLLAGELEAIEYHENAVLTRSGEERLVAWHNAILRDGEGRIIGHLSSGEDITERKRAEEALAQEREKLALANIQLEQANAELLELDRMKSEFLSNVSHELRTPLAAVKAYAETIVDYGSIPQEKRDSFMNIIIEQSERLAVVIEDLLDLSRIEAGELKLTLTPIDVRQVAEAALQSVAPVADKKGIDIRVETPAEEERVLADEQRLVQVLINLLNNAVKFTGPGGVIKVTAAPVANSMDSSVSGDTEPAYLCITVSDNGEGIPLEELEHVFDKFKQVADRTKGKPGGTGLGLAICKELLENMRGRIWVESTVGEGSDFRFTLPLAQSTDAESTETEVKSKATVEGAAIG